MLRRLFGSKWTSASFNDFSIFQSYLFMPEVATEIQFENENLTQVVFVAVRGLGI